MTKDDQMVVETESTAPKKRIFRKIHTKLSKVRRVLLGRYLWITRITVLVLVLGVIGLVGDFFVRHITNTTTGEYVRLGTTFLFPRNEVVNIFEGKTNVLILGKGGGSHEAPDLTDTMILASISHESPQKVSLLSLPRDIWIPELRTKLNTVYYYGNKQQAGAGLVAAKSSVEEITGQQINYGVVFDFQGFSEIINILGGVDVEVEKSFTDERFPIAGKENDLCDGDKDYGCRYEKITFEAGTEHMDGERALKYVRSRHSQDLEAGTDIARSQRQRSVIDAVIKKMTSREVLFSPTTLRNVFEAFQSNMETDLTADAIAVLGRRVYQGRNNLQSYNIPEELITVPPYAPEYDNLYVFIPKANDWSEVQKWIQDIL